jgi:hypothetical protein
MGEHIDIRTPVRKQKLKEHDPNARRARVTFKRYLQDLEEEQAYEDLDLNDDQDLNQGDQEPLP